VVKVDKIVGAGKEYVALDKKEVLGIVGIDMFDGVSEVIVVDDKYYKHEWV
jgi:Histidinol dehydrogenase